ncbi:hypothetical protein AO364_1887 [Moraxella catarrhalis]|uniref:hypothetical protein n=1 Tax=Moraxella catarrhalis TaxID=480 RepID=UPI0007E8AE46|nr:hypothetical protein [Moraxella catarrhalis]OAV34502.1 hypothetical protein AO364_1887 [Moraxella catarrhalis]
MIKAYLTKLSHDLHTTTELLGKISQVSNNQSVSGVLDNITNRLDIHAKQLDKIVNHMNEKQPHGER